MKTIHAFIRMAMSFIGLAFDEVNPVYWKLIKWLVWLILMAPIGLACNVLWYPEINIAFLLFFAAATVTVWYYPENVAIIALTGAVTKKLSGGILIDGAKGFLVQYWKVLKTVLLVETVIFFYLSFIPFAEHPMVFFVLIAGSITATLVADHLKIKGTLAIELVLYGICVIMALSFLSLVPVESWGGKVSFGQVLASNIKEGIFVFTLLLAIIVTLSMKGFRKWAFILFGVMDLMFMPMNMLWGHLPSWPWSGTSSAQANIQPTAQVASPPARVMETIIANGDHFTYKNIPDGISIEFFCPSGTLMDFTYSGMPEEEKGFIDCDTGGKNLVLGAYKTGRHIGFMSKDANQKLATVTTVTSS